VSAFSDVGSVDPHRIWDGIHGRVVDGSEATLAVIELDANGVVPEHSHANEQLGVLISGSLRFRVGGETRELGPGGMWRIPPHVPHDVTVGPEGAVVVEAFAPRRADWEALERVPGTTPRWP
jgi:quercetin dioxygenase-like cupin family protein